MCIRDRLSGSAKPGSLRGITTPEPPHRRARYPNSPGSCLGASKLRRNGPVLRSAIFHARSGCRGGLPNSSFRVAVSRPAMTEMRREATAGVPPQKSCRIAVLKSRLKLSRRRKIDLPIFITSISPSAIADITGASLSHRPSKYRPFSDSQDHGAAEIRVQRRSSSVGRNARGRGHQVR